MDKRRGPLIQADLSQWAAIGTPIVAMIFLFISLYSSREQPHMTGGVGFLDILLILIFTLLNIFINLLILEGVSMVWMASIMVNFIAFAIWYRYQVYQIWIFINLIPFWISKLGMIP